MHVDAHLLAELERKEGGRGPLTKGLSVARRCAIRYYFEYVFGAPAEDALDERDGRIWDGVAYLIEDLLLMPAGSRAIVFQVFRDVLEALEAKEIYDPSKGPKKRGNIALIQEDTPEALIVINSMRCGLSLAESTSILNSYLLYHERGPVSYAAVQRYAARSKVVDLHRRGTKKAGSNDAKSAWAQARVVQCEQFKEQFNNGIKWDNAPLRHKPQFNFPPLSLDGLSIWDEHHKKTKLGHSGKWETVICFKDGYPAALEDGGKWEEKRPNTSQKYPKEVRGCFGVAVTTTRTQAPVGHRLDVYDYTGKWVYGPKKYEELIVEEMRRSRLLPKQPFDYVVKYPNAALRRQVLKDKMDTLGNVDVRDIMTHVVGEHKRFFSGTKREKSSFIFHDGLTAWWEADAQEHMRSLGFGDRQLRILPANNSKVASYYQNGLAGNSPEMCRGLDAHGFADLGRSLTLNCSIAASLPRDDPERLKWGMGTPKTLLYSMLRSWEHSPSSERIVEDIYNFPMVLDKIIKAEGCVVPDEILRTGRRAISGGSKDRSRTRKNTIRSADHHPDLDNAWKAMMDPEAIEANFKRVGLNDAE